MRAATSMVNVALVTLLTGVSVGSGGSSGPDGLRGGKAERRDREVSLLDQDLSVAGPTADQSEPEAWRDRALEPR